MTKKPGATDRRWLAARQLGSFSILATMLASLAAALLSSPASAANTGSSGSPAACSSLPAPGTFQSIQGTSDDIFLSGFTAGATVTVGYRNNDGSSSYTATVTRIAGPAITPTSATQALGNNAAGSTTFSYVSGTGTLQLRVGTSNAVSGPVPEYSVSCAPSLAGLTLSKTTLSVNEADATSDTLTVRLSSQPTANVTVAVSASDATEGAITTPTSLTFTTVNWNTPQNVTLQAVNDDVDDGNIAYNVVLDPGGSDPVYNLIANTTASATTVDDDTAGLTLSKTTLSVNETGTTSDTLTVRLSSQPTADVTVTVSASDVTEGAITTPTTLTFTTANWNTPQNITLQAVNDDIDDGNITYNVVLNPASSDTVYNALANSTASATTVDDDTAGLTLSKTFLSVNEAGATSDTLTVRLASQPTANITVALTSSDTTEGTITTATPLTFTIANWSTPQNVTLQAVNDGLDDGDIAYNVVLNPGGDGVYNALANTNVSATTVDDDTAGLTLSKSTLSVNESGTTSDTLTVRLSSQPTATVTVAVSSGDTTEGTITSAASLTFTAANWSTAQNVTLRAVNDSLDDGDISYFVVLNPASSDAIYSAMANTNVSAATIDDDTAGLTLSKSTLSVNEAGTTSDTLTVRLSSQPTASVTVAVTSGDTTEGTITSSASLTFTTVNWNTAQNVTLRAVNDNLDDGDISYAVMLDSASTDAIFSALANTNVSATTVDDDTRGVTVSPTTVSATEGGATGSFTVVLTSQPTANVTISLTSDAQCTISAASLTFTTVNWNSVQTVTVTAVNDNVVEGAHICSVTTDDAAGGDYAGFVVADVTANITDNDTATASITKATDGDGAEPGDAGEFTVTLSAPSAANTVVSYSVGGSAQAGSDYTTLAGSVTVLAGSTTAVIPVTLLDDGLVEGTEMVSVSLTGTSNPLISASGSASLNIADDDSATASIAKSTGGDGAEPGDAGEFTVMLSAPSSTDTTVSYTVGGTASAGSDYTTLAGSVTVPAGSTTAVIPVEVADDAVVEGTKTVTINLTGTSNPVIQALGTATLDIADDDRATASIAKPTDGDGAEPDDDGEFTVTLSAPSATDTVASYSVTGSAQAGSDYTPLAGSVTIPAGSTTAAIPVAVVDDAVVEGTETVTLELTGTSNPSIQASGSATLEIADDDTAAASITKPAGGDGAEPGDDGEFTLTLSAPSSSDTTVSYLVSGTANAGSDYTGLAGSVTVPAGSTTAVIPLDVIDDAVVEGVETVTIDLTGTSNPSIQASGSATLDIADDDTAAASITKPAGGDGAEPGDDGEFTLTLSAPSSSDTTVSYLVSGTANAGSDYTGLSGSMTVPAGSTTAVIPVEVIDDAVVEGTETVTIDLTGTSNPVIQASGSAALDLADDDSATASFTRTAGDDGAEPGDDGEITVVLSAPSSTDTTITYLVGGTASAGGDYAALAGSVTVPAGSMTAIVPVNVVDDVIVEGTETVIVSLTGTSNPSIQASGSATLDITDDDTATASIAKSTNGDAAEPGDDGEFTLFLSAPSSTDTTVDYSAGGAAAAGSDYTSLPGSVAVPAGSTTASIQVAVLDDVTVEGSETVAISLNGTSNPSIGAAGSATLDMLDDDNAAVTVTESGGSTSVGEGGIIDSFTIVLDAQPTADVTISLSADAQCTLSTGSVTFTPVSWNVAQSVTVTAVDDPTVEGAHSCAITTGDAAGDGYTGVTVDDVTASVTDNDIAGVTIAGSPVSITEGGPSGSFTVVLTAQPTADVTISLSPDAQCALSAGSVTFTPISWNVGQSVTVTAVDDPTVEGAHSCAITTGDAAGDGYTGVAVDDVTANVADNDVAGVTIAGSPVAIAEGGVTGSFNMVLDAQPTADVTISLNPDVQCTLSAGSVTFTPVSWNVTQSVTVTAVDDPTVEGAHSCAITTGDATGDGYTGVAVDDVTANVADNDVAGVTVAGSPVSITEGGPGSSFTVTLTAQPTADVTISLSPDAQCTLSAGSVTFTPVSWNVTQSVTVTAVDDPTVEGAHSCAITTGDAAGDGYTGVAVDDVTANVTDNDIAAVTVAGSPVPITEGGSGGNFTLALTAQPTADVTISLSADAKCTLSDSSLTFTPANWSAAQSVTVTAVDDTIAEGPHSCAITTGDAAGDGYTGVVVDDVTANVTDNDTAGVIVAGSPVAVTEGGASGSFAIALTAQPTADVTISLSPDSQCTLSAGSLTFTPSNWSAAQSVTVTAVNDTVAEGTHSCAITTGDAVGRALPASRWPMSLPR
ncbi:hypothetical protein G5V57_22300 [Nordella sp. HKS 07]|uniref:Calx-beta domain-containing protein n=1 Tax=Nordella sp. HKS 07 TaxID=2712222 RepID=UPI0013E14364|nr:Calx-beta domain-containing protein [Nordella sp. HKS 07]QIG50214.1 hypothetical protein G5V57_22300 [Nordella sp. HKS 07]